jgi:hypothetical protein
MALTAKGFPAMLADTELMGSSAATDRVITSSTFAKELNREEEEIVRSTAA